MRNRTALFALLSTIVVGGGLAACGDDPATPTDAGADAPTTTVPTGTPDASPDAPVGPTAIASGPSRGSAVALSWNDATLVAVNRDVGSVTVFDVKYGADGAPPTLTKKAEIPVGGEPWQVAISPDNESAFVVLRKDQKLVRISGLSGASPAVAGSVATGSEPTAVALSPTGKTAWVANWVDGHGARHRHRRAQGEAHGRP
jgi:DNA-binding beta-propeller fold protein YncE